MNDAEFDLLKEDLSWNGSPVVNLNRKEAKYLAAVQAYLKGTPTLSDSEFDSLKAELKEEGSQFASSKEPRCYIGKLLVLCVYLGIIELLSHTVYSNRHWNLYRNLSARQIPQ